MARTVDKYHLDIGELPENKECVYDTFSVSELNLVLT